MNLTWCGVCNHNDCVCAFKRGAVGDVAAFIKQANAGQDAARARRTFRDALIPVLERTRSTRHLDEYMSAYDALRAAKPKEYTCTRCIGKFTTTQQPHICPFCQQAQLSQATGTNNGT